MRAVGDLRNYFFLTGFLVAFFFMVLFSLVLGFAALLPGFFAIAIHDPPVRVAAV